jgi:Kef-type K+ transport system membrane component KefB
VEAINEFLAPFFFFTMGARLDLRVLDPDLLVSAGVISLLAIIAKILGCGLPVMSRGREVAMQVGVGMTPRGEVGLIVALIGLQMNMISPSAYAIVIFMTAATTLFAPPVLRVLFKTSPAQPAKSPQLEAIADLRTGIATAGAAEGIKSDSE